jgi:hypothetical protein
MTVDPAQLNRIETCLRVLISQQKPQISFAEIHERLGYGSKTSTLRWINEHRLVRVGPRKFRTIDFLNASVKAAS